MEGIGGPINLNPYYLDGIDPCLEDCCRREVEGNRRHNALISTLRRYDVAALAERRRRHVVNISGRISSNGDGGEYRALTEFKEQKHREFQKEEESNEKEEKQIPVKEEQIITRNDYYNSNNERFLGDKEIINDDSDGEFDFLLDEDVGIENEGVKELEDQRRAELEYQLLMRQIASYHGYGVQRQVHPSRVLSVAGLGRASIPNSASSELPPPAVVLHLFDPDSTASASLDYYLEMDFAKQYAGTIFLRSEGRSVLLMDLSFAQKSFPSDVLDTDRDMPALIAIRDGLVVKTCPGLLGLVSGRDDTIEPHAVRSWLDRSGVLLSDPRFEDVCMVRSEYETHMDFTVSQKEKQVSQQGEKRYNCGIEGCNKSFMHEHIGIKTEEQDGLVIKEETILGNDE